ncbi:MAG: hypothetical protein ACREQI_16730 [Candidatus Binataceae bacterium]
MLPGSSSAPTQTLSDGDDCDGAFTGTFHGIIYVSRRQNCTFANGAIYGNVIVNGGTLALSGDAIHGDVTVLRNSAFRISSYTEIDGNLDAGNLSAGGTANYLCDSFVDGNLLLDGNQADMYIGSQSTALCGGDGIGGDLVAGNNRGVVAITGGTVDGNALLIHNLSNTEVFQNTVGGLLQCAANVAIAAAGNTAWLKLGQCAGVSGDDDHGVEKERREH